MRTRYPPAATLHRLAEMHLLGVCCSSAPSLQGAHTRRSTCAPKHGQLSTVSTLQRPRCKLRTTVNVVEAIAAGWDYEAAAQAQHANVLANDLSLCCPIAQPTNRCLLLLLRLSHLMATPSAVAKAKGTPQGLAEFCCARCSKGAKRHAPLGLYQSSERCKGPQVQTSLI